MPNIILMLYTACFLYESRPAAKLMSIRTVIVIDAINTAIVGIQCEIYGQEFLSIFEDRAGRRIARSHASLNAPFALFKHMTAPNLFSFYL